MKIKQHHLIMAILLFLLGFIISVQFQNVRITTGKGLISASKANDLLMELEEIQEERNNIIRELSTIENKIKAYESSAADDSYVIKSLQEELLRFQILSGNITLVGPGILIAIEEPIYEDDEYLYDYWLYLYYDYIIKIINAINVAGADAITINDQRYMAMTEINHRKNTLIVNSVPITPPIHIAAIGDPKRLKEALTIPFGIMDEIKDRTGLQVIISAEERIVVPRSNRLLQFQYSRPVEN